MPETLTLHVPSMHCGGCVGRVERALGAAPGVRAASANLATHRVTVDFDAPADLSSISEILEKAGYPAETTTQILDIEGMHCASCVGRVEAALAAVPGVVSARVNLAAETAEIRAAGELAAARLAEAVAQAGYTASPRGETGESPDERRAREARTLKRDVAIAGLLTLPVFLVEMGGHLVPGVHALVGQTIGHQTSRVLQFVLTALVLFGPGLRFFRIGLPALLRGAPDMNALVALGAGAAFAYSTLVTFAPALLPETARAVYFEAAAVIVTLILAGRWLEARAKGRTGAAISRLAALQPRRARVLRDGVAVEVDLEDLRKGDLIEVRPGERIAADGVVTEGRSAVDEAMISGEPVPVAKEPGAEVIGGTVNGAGALTVRATAVGADAALARIVAMVEAAQAAKLPIQALVDRITLYFVPAVLVVAAVTVAVWLAFGPSLTHALVAGVSVLIIACPCAMGLATPVSIMVGMGRAAELGVLFRRGEALQALAGVTRVAFDKTGTLTEGRPEVTGVVPAAGADADRVLRVAAAVEARSEHPLAGAVVRAAAGRGPDRADVENFEAVPGQGARGRVDGTEVIVGSARYLEGAGVDTAPLRAEAERLAEKGAIVIHVGLDGRAAAVLALADPVKPGAKAAVAALREAGVNVAMVTGDGHATARAVARTLGIDAVQAEVLPGDKAATVEAWRGDGPVAFVGDGINDAPALAAADVGLAIGSGTDIAIEAADVVLTGGRPEAVAEALTLSRATLRNIRQNLGWAFGYNILLIPVAAGVLYPAFGVLLSPMLAAGAMALSSVAVLTNALRLRRSGRAGTPAAVGGTAPIRRISTTA